MTRPAAFFDVDGTLTVRTSIFRFLAYYLAGRGEPARSYDTALAELDRLKAGGAGRTEANRAFYRNLAGAVEAELLAAGERWFAAEQAAGGLFAEPVLARLRDHAAAGDLVVLLSGSFTPCLAPIARFVGADLVRCTEPVVDAGRYTGDVTTPMVGAHKAEAARALADAYRLDLAACTAYGDDASDLDLLMLVGNPVVVGDDEVLVRHAHRRGWQRLSRELSPSTHR